MISSRSSARRRRQAFVRLCTVLATLVATTLSPLGSIASLRADELVMVTVGTKRYVGDPLFMSSNQILLLLRDGRLRELPGTSAAQVEKIGEAFQGYSSVELRSRLAREFGSNFEITPTRHYVVVHPRGQAELWPVRFEELYAHFVHYFSVRGLQLAEPRVPLVAIVLHDRREFMDYARSRNDAIDGSVVGYYSSSSNRIALFDVTGGSGNSQQWLDNAPTIYHEAAHQAAFNTGVHGRFTGPPRWAAEGLGTLFEAPAVWSGNTYASSDGRLNRRMLDLFLREVGEQPEQISLRSLIESDAMFDSHPEGAYCRAWAISYFLAETRPYEYAAYLAATAEKSNFRRVSSEERLNDWLAHFPEDPRALENHILQFIRTL